MRRVEPLAALLGLLLLVSPAVARSAIVIVVENNEKAAQQAPVNPALLEAAAIPTERLLRNILVGALESEAATERSARPSRRRAQRAPTPPADDRRSAPPSYRPKLPAGLRRWLGDAGSSLLADTLEPQMDRFGEPFYARLLALSAARHWDRVVVLTDDEARFSSFARTLRDLDQAGYTIDVLLDIHGSSAFTELGNGAGAGPDQLRFTGGAVTPRQIRDLGRGHKLRLNAVYMAACWGSRFNEAWLAAGARGVNGARELNYYVLVSPLAFLYGFSRGLDLETASRRAFRIERRLLDHKVLDEALAGMYGQRGVTRIQSARSSARVHAGARVQAAFVIRDDTSTRTPDGF